MAWSTLSWKLERRRPPDSPIDRWRDGGRRRLGDYFGPVTSLRRVAPVFVTADLARALNHYERLGFVVEAYEGGDDYGYACRDGIEITLPSLTMWIARRPRRVLTSGLTMLVLSTMSGRRQVWLAGSYPRPQRLTDLRRALTLIPTGT